MASSDASDSPLFVIVVSGIVCSIVVFTLLVRTNTAGSTFSYPRGPVRSLLEAAHSWSNIICAMLGPGPSLDA